MKEEKCEKKEHHWNALKGSLLYRLATGDIPSLNKEQEAVDKKDEGSAEGKDRQETIPALSRSVKIPQDSVLYGLWSEWKNASQEEAELYLEEFYDEISPVKPLPCSPKDAELEKIRLKVELQKVAQKRKSVLSAALGKGEAPSLDAEPILHVFKNRLAAWLFVFPPVGEGMDLTWELLEDFLNQSELSFGIDHELLRRLIDERLYFVPLRIATGVAAVAQEDGKVIPRILTDQLPQTPEGEKGSIDFKAITHFHMVKKDEIICRILFPSGGSKGMDITGKEIPFSKGKPATPPRGTNTAMNSDQDALIALVDGHLVMEGGNYHVRSALVVPNNVDYSTGNIDFTGDVQIKGDIRGGFTVRATGSITVGGIIEGAQVEANGEIIIGKGVLGDGKAVIRSRRSIKARYLENCTVYAEESILASAILSSNLSCNGTVCVMTGHGTIIGGVIASARQIEARIIGSETSTATELRLGFFPHAEKERRQVLRELGTVRKAIAELETSIAYLGRSPLDKTSEINRCRLKKSALLIRRTALEKKVEELSKDQVEDPSTCRVICSVVYPGTQIYINDISYSVRQTSRQCKIHLSEDGQEIVLY